MFILLFTLAGCKDNNINRKIYKTIVDNDGDVGVNTSIIGRKDKIYIS